jgi:hypothetical protein
VRAPNPLRWLWYAVGGRLPDAHREWVLYDLTVGTWVLRHFARALVQHSIWLLLLVLPIPLDLRLWMLAAALGVGLFYSLCFIEDASERRLIMHGFPVGLNRKIREESPRSNRAELAAMYAAWYIDRPNDK